MTKPRFKFTETSTTPSGRTFKIETPYQHESAILESHSLESIFRKVLGPLNSYQTNRAIVDYILQPGIIRIQFNVTRGDWHPYADARTALKNLDDMDDLQGSLFR